MKSNRAWCLHAPRPGAHRTATAHAPVRSLDSFDTIEDLVIEGGSPAEVLTGVSLRRRIVTAWPESAMTSDVVLTALEAHWRAWGWPAYSQFDNDMRFHRPHQFPDTIGRVTWLCLVLDIVPVFAPVQEHGFQAKIPSDTELVTLGR